MLMATCIRANENSKHTCSDMAQRELSASPRKPNCKANEKIDQTQSLEQNRSVRKTYRVELREIVKGAKLGCSVLLSKHLVIVGMNTTTVIRHLEHCTQYMARQGCEMI
jgi:hypothetical protein